jgi:hypothetical protein
LLDGIVPPHEPKNPAHVASLVEAYQHGDRLDPVVALRFDNDVRAISGSHRIAAMGVRYDSVEDAETAGALIILDAADLLSAAREADDHDAVVELTHPERWRFFPDVLKTLWPYLPEHAQFALRQEERLS